MLAIQSNFEIIQPALDTGKYLSLMEALSNSCLIERRVFCLVATFSRILPTVIGCIKEFLIEQYFFF